MAWSAAGIIIGPDFVQAIEAKRTFKGVAIAKAFAAPLSASTDLAQAIRQAMAGAAITAKRVGVSISAQEVLLRSFSLPLLPKSEWRSAVQSEARKHIPFKPEELVWDFHAAEDRANRQLRVAFMGVETKAFGRIKDALGALGLSPAFIEPQSVSLSRFPLPEWKAEQEEYVAIVEINAAFAHIVIAKQQAPYFIRDVSFLPAAARQQAGAPPGESSGGAQAGEGLSEWEAAPDRRAEVLLGELRLSVGFFTREHPQAVVKRAVLVGDEAAIASWRSWLSRQSGLVIEGGMMPASGGGALRVSASAMGLAIRSLRSVPVHPDFLQASVASVKKSKEGEAAAPQRVVFDRSQLQGLVKPAIAQAVAAIVILAGLKIMGTQELARGRHAREAALRPSVEMPAAFQQKTKLELDAMEKQLTGRLAFLKQLKSERLVMTEKLDVLARTLPDGVWFDSVSFSDRLDAVGGQRRQTKLTVEGACFLPGAGGDEVEVISGFAADLKAHAEFTRNLSQIALTEVASEEDPERTYHYQTFRLECGPGRPL